VISSGRAAGFAVRPFVLDALSSVAMRRAFLVGPALIASTGVVMCSSFGASAPATDADAAVAPVIDGAPDAPHPVPPGADASASCPVTTPTDQLVAYYPFDEVSGQGVPDCAQFGNDGVVIGTSAAAWQPGKKGNALRLSSATGCVELGPFKPLDFTSAFSVTAWINVASFPALANDAGYVVGKTTDPDLGGWRLATGSAGMINAAIGRTGGPRLAVEAPIAKGVWTHVAFVVVPGGDLTLYVDGTALKVSSVPSPLVPDAKAVARIGCQFNGTQPFDGLVDDLHIYTRALLLDEVRNLGQ
jgi:hypothetical protein